jgi:outer membrane protein assembly factor BamB
LYVGTIRSDNAGGGVVALDAHTGAERWRAALGTTVLRLIEPLWLEDGVLVVPSSEADIVGLDAATGTERWRFHTPAARVGSLTVARGRVWFLLENARFYVLDLQDGRPVARFAEVELNLNTQGFSQRPVIVGNRVLMAAGLALFGFDVPEGTP